MKNYVLALFVMSFIGCSNIPQDKINIIPTPKEVQIKNGTFKFNSRTKVFVESDDQKPIFGVLQKKFNTVAEWNLEIYKTKRDVKQNYIEFRTDNTLKPEAYSLDISNDRILIKSNSRSGFLYGVESLRQLLSPEIEKETIQKNITWEVKNLVIFDEPRFAWRGLMLDVSRHFFDKNYVKEVIDNLAMHKMNVLHLHLLDDQGWRIEIKKYPKLTEIGAFREDHEDKHWNARPAIKNNEKATLGGFYTQEDIKEIVAYAQSKSIEVVPEIEMPAHVMSAIASYPELSCNNTKIGVPSGGVWPITEIYCAGKENTFDFLEDVLTEVIALFPSKYIHIGGDEATKTNWKTCPHCQTRMKKENLETEEELQSYFIKRIEKFINSQGKKLIGWDEILEGGLAPDATVMSWRGVKGGLEASEQGHDVIMSPGTHCYFDHYQGPQNNEPLAIGGYTPLSKVYTFDPIVDTMTEEQKKHVLGGQANLWSEYIPTNEQSEYMIYPRISALSETLWSPKESRDWNDFSRRVKTMFKRYENLGLNYAKSSYSVTMDAKVNMDNKTVEITLENEFPNSDIRYSLDGEEEFKKYISPIKLTKTTLIKSRLYEDNQPIGKLFEDVIQYHKAVGKKVTYTDEPNARYKGTGEYNMVNLLRGTKNFHDNRWQAWLSKDMDITISLEEETTISEVIVGALENQGPGIYFPLAIEVYISNDDKEFTKIAEIKRAFKEDGTPKLKDFVLKFDEVSTKYVKVKALNLEKPPKGNETFIFIDEVVVN